jgi:hypothetical protein
LQLFLVRVLQAQILDANPLAAVFAALAAIRIAKEHVLVTVQTRVAEAALVHAIIHVRILVLVRVLVHAVVHAQTAVLVAALAAMVTVMAVTVVVPLAPALAGTVTALELVPFIATMKLLAVMTAITSVATLNSKEWRC